MKIGRFNCTVVLVLGTVIGGCQVDSTSSNDQSNAFDTKIAAIEDPEIPTEMSLQFKDRFDKSPERTAKTFLREFDKLSGTDGVTKDTILNHIKQEKAQLRAMVIAELLNRDLDGNGRISKEELIWFSTRSSNRSRYGMNTDTLSADENTDGELSLSEIIIHSRTTAEVLHSEVGISNSPKSYLMVFDGDQDGIVTRDEMNEAFSPYLGDATIELQKPSVQDPSQNKRKTTAGKSLKLGKSCDLPTANKNAEIIVLGGYESDTFSSVAVAGQDKAAYATNITIEPGNSDIHIIATSYMPMLWVVDGDTKRVKSFVSQPAKSGRAPGQTAAIAGLSKKKIQYIDQGCLPYRFEPGSKDELLAKGKVNSIIGREPDHVVSRYKLTQVSLPSGNFAEAVKSTRRPQTTVRERNLAAYKVVNKVVQIPLDDLVSDTPLEYYTVLPGSAGLKQLIDEGKIIALKDRSYHIVKPITRFPARLTGGHSVSFVLGKGVPMPEGSPGHSKVYSEETGELINKL